MGLIVGAVAILSVLTTLTVAVLSRLIADDIKAWQPKIVQKLIERAVRRLPEDERERFAEEWTEHLEGMPGDLSKIAVAIGLLRASKTMAREVQGTQAVPIYERLLATAALALFLPSILATALIIKLGGGPGPVFVHHTYVGKGKRLTELRFRTAPIRYDEATNRYLLIRDKPLPAVFRFIRAATLNGQTPRLFNILQGRSRFNRDGSPLRIVKEIKCFLSKW